MRIIWKLEDRQQTRHVQKLRYPYVLPTCFKHDVRQLCKSQGPYHPQKVSHPRGNNTSKSHVHFRIGGPPPNISHIYRISSNRLNSCKLETGSRRENLSCLQLCSHRRHGQDKTVLSCPCRRCEQPITEAQPRWHPSTTIFNCHQKSIHWTLLPDHKINIKARALVILNQII